MEHKKEAQEARTSEFFFDATTYYIKSMLPDNRTLRDILLRIAVSEAINQAAQ